MSTSQTAITVIPQVDSPVLASAMQNLSNTLYASAEANIDAAISDNPSAYTALEYRAMVVTEALRLTSGMDLTTIIMRGNLIRQIEQEGLVGVHPNGYANLTVLAGQNNVSTGEFSDIRNLCDVIFPYLQNTLGLNLIEIWDGVGKSKFREMVPALRSIITGQNADHNSVRVAVRQMLDSAAASLIAEEQLTQEELTSDSEEERAQADAAVRRQAVMSLLTSSQTLTTREMRRAVRPARVAPIEMATLQTDEAKWYAVLRFESQEQKDLAMRVLNSHTNNQLLSLRDAQTSHHRRLLRSFFGDTDE